MSSITDLAKKGDDIIIGGGSFQDNTSGQTSYVLSIFNLKTRSHSLINLDFLPHGISPHPTLPHHILICEKIGPFSQPGKFMNFVQIMQMTVKICEF